MHVRTHTRTQQINTNSQTETHRTCVKESRAYLSMDARLKETIDKWVLYNVAVL